MNVTRYEEEPAVPALSAREKTALQRYARRCRNLDKQAYALAYADFLQELTDQEPPRPEGLSYMGAQAVHLAMRDLIYAERI